METMLEAASPRCGGGGRDAGAVGSNSRAGMRGGGGRARGYFLPDEEELIRLRYSQYLGIAGGADGNAGRAGGCGRAGRGWSGRDRLPVFATAFAAACVLMRADRFLVELAAERPVVWKKLDEEDPLAGIPRKTFTAIYKAVSDPLNARRFLVAADFYAEAPRGDPRAGGGSGGGAGGGTAAWRRSRGSSGGGAMR